MEIKLGQPLSFTVAGERQRQEDARYPDNDNPGLSSRVFIVCDGVGGKPGGSEASHAVAAVVGEAAEREAACGKFTDEAFSRVFAKGYSALEAAAKRFKEGIATTIAMVVFSSDGAFVAHAGDSRVYQIRPGVGIMHQSQDHSLVNMLVHLGQITPEDGLSHPKRNVIMRCMDSASPKEQRTAETCLIRDVQPGDYFYLCTDGAVGMIQDGDLALLLASKAANEEKIKNLERLCGHSSDNATVMLIPIDKSEQGNITNIGFFNKILKSCQKIH